VLGISFVPAIGADSPEGEEEGLLAPREPLVPAAVVVPDRAAREALAEGSLLAGMAIAQTRTALCHAISYPLTAHFGVPHGLACAFSMAEVASYVLPHDDGRLDRLAQRLFGPRARAWQLPHRFWGLVERSGAASAVRAQVPSLEAMLALVGEMQTPGRADNLLRPADAPAIAGMLRRAWETTSPEVDVVRGYRTGARQRTPRVLTRPLQVQFGPLIETLLVALDHRGVRAWLDSGSLLGVVRDGALPPWDKDLDLGVWREDAEAVREVLQGVAERFGARLQEKHLGGRAYAWVLSPVPVEGAATLPVAVHIFDRVGDTAVSEQPHFLLAHRAAYVRHHLRMRKREVGGGLRGLLQARLERRRWALLDLMHRVRLRRPLRALLQISTRARNGVEPIHAAERRWLGWLHERFQWVVPRRFFEELQALPISGARVWLPADAEAYLALRYGETWRRPRKNWVYTLHDGTLRPLGGVTQRSAS
jgi:hypothetical protein